MWMAGVVTFLGILALAAGIVVRLRQRTRERTRAPGLDDAAVQRILRKGQVWLEHDEPLDPEVIRQEEDRFWEEVRWDGAVQWSLEGREEGREPWQEGR
jgi:hypothetical protein